MALAEGESPARLAKEVRRRLSIIGRARSFVDWSGVRALANDIEAQRRAIVETLAQADPNEAFELLWRFMALAEPIFARCDDSNGIVRDVFHHACRDIGQLAQRVAMEPEILADKVFSALAANAYGQFDHLISVTASALGTTGIDHLKARLVDLSNTPVQRPVGKDRMKIGWSSSGPIYADEVEERSRINTVKLALREIADVQGDADAFMAQYDTEARRIPRIAAEIARRFLAADRPQEALAILEAAEHRGSESWEWSNVEWENARIDVLEVVGRTEEAQKTRWNCFAHSLSAVHLRDFLKKMPDFEDMEAEEEALDLAERHPNRLGALSFFVAWPALHRAAKLVTEHPAGLDGDRYEHLTPAADALAAKHPLAATLVLRAMIDFSLSKSRTSRYKHAARHLLECRRLAPGIADFRTFETHRVYEARLLREHGRKSFWSLLT